MKKEYQFLLKKLKNTEIKEYIIKFYNEKDKEKVFNNVKAILNRMNKEGIIETAYKGIYYIPNENVFGKMLLGNRQIIQYKYIMDKDGNVKGYVTGAKLFNEAHLTTQVPNIIDIATNECKNFNKYENKNLNVIIRKPKIEINNENYKYLQLFDLIENKDNIGIEVDNPDEIIYNFIEENELDFEKIIKYAMDTKSRTRKMLMYKSTLRSFSLVRLAKSTILFQTDLCQWKGEKKVEFTFK